jgi:hypothetical protein
MHKERGNAPILRDVLCPVAEVSSISECIAVWASCIELEAGDQMEEIIDDHRHAPPARLCLVVGDDVAPGVERQEQLGKASGLARRAPEPPHQPRHRQEGRRIARRLVRDQHRVAGHDPLLKPQPLALAQR